MPTLARKYAGIMGALAMTVAILRAVKAAEAPDAALWTALGLTLVFAAVGLAAGWLADAVVVECVRAQAEKQLRSITSHTTPTTETSPGP